MNKTANFALGIALALLAQGGMATERVQAGDAALDCAAIGRLQNAMGQGANKAKRVDKEVDLDATAMARLSLQGLATINQALAELMRQ